MYGKSLGRALRSPSNGMSPRGFPATLFTPSLRSVRNHKQSIVDLQTLFPYQSITYKKSPLNSYRLKAGRIDDD